MKLNIPNEHAFIYNNETKDIYQNKRDANNPSKYTFQYPPEWTTANSGDKIIGFRSLWVSAAARSISVWIGMQLTIGDQWPDGTISSSEEETNFKSILFHCRISDDWNVFHNALQNALARQLGESYRGIIVSESTFLSRTKTTDDENMVCRNQKYWSYYNQESFTNGAPDNYGIRIHTELKRAEHVYTELALYLDDAKAVFHGEDFEPDTQFNDPTHKTNCYEFYDVWGRKSCVVKSNIASGVQHNYLGHSHVRYDPLKYYRINNDDKTFTIELLISNNNFPVILPFDDRETITIEYVILQNATELYT
jgi:hypothetical protein